MRNVHPVLAKIINDFVAVTPGASWTTGEQFFANDFIKSDFCTECDGEGFIWLHDPYTASKKEQCFECERLHRLEVRADRLHDEMKGN